MLKKSTCALLFATTTASLTAVASLPPTPIEQAPLPHSAVVVFDIDGTLTPHNLFVHEARPGAAEVVNSYAARGYQVIYVSTRVPLFQAGLTAWLHKHGFVPGPVHVAQNSAERRDPVGFKAAILQGYQQAGWTLSYAYGDSATDFSAYERAGIAPQQVFALKRRFSRHCQPGVYRTCLDGWGAHLTFVEHEVPLQATLQKAAGTARTPAGPVH